MSAPQIQESESNLPRGVSNYMHSVRHPPSFHLRMRKNLTPKTHLNSKNDDDNNNNKCYCHQKNSRNINSFSIPASCRDGCNGRSSRSGRLSSTGSPALEEDGIFLNSTSSKLLERAQGILLSVTHTETHSRLLICFHISSSYLFRNY